MRNRDEFAGFHPLVNFLWFALTLTFSMLLLHPVCLAVSLAAAFAYSVYLNGARAVRFNLLCLLPLLLLTALLNPAFNHAGETILRYLPSGNPLTLESILYGFAAGAMLAAVLCWFSCWNAVMSADKFVYLFGRIAPALSLVLSMTLRFVPRFKAQIKTVADAQRMVGRDPSTGGIPARAKKGLTILSIMLSWTMEGSIATADSMRSRGFGLPGRSAFSIYRFERRDAAALAFCAADGGFLVAAKSLGALDFRYFPSVKGVGGGALSVTAYLAWLALCLLPLAVDLAADRRWAAVRKGALGPES